MTAVVRIGILGAAAIAPNAIIRPAGRSSRAVIAAVAARDPERARAFATKWSIPTTHRSYDDLLGDDDIDAVYVPTPNGLHGRWTIAALGAGKHVLCEKPLTANAEEARTVATVAEQHPDLVAMEAYHWRYHPMARRTLDLLAGGVIGRIVRAAGSFCVPNLRRRDIRWNWALAGGSLMDLGCYPLHMLRTFVSPTPTVRSAKAKALGGRIDRALTAHLDADGAMAVVRCSMLSRRLLSVSFRLDGTDGTIHLRNPVLPHLGGRITVTSGARTSTERADPVISYDAQLGAFCAAILDGAPNLTPVADSAATMDTIDSIYRAAGMPIRQPTGSLAH